MSVKERGEAEFSVYHVIGSKLFKDVFGYDAQRVFSLHELEAARSAGEEVGETGALRRSDEFGVVLRAVDFGRETRDGGVAQGAVEMEVEFDFVQEGHYLKRSTCDLNRVCGIQQCDKIRPSLWFGNASV